MTINNLSDLRAEIAILKDQKTVQEAAIKAHFSSPSAIFATIFSGLKSPGIKNALFNPEDLISLASRFILPFALNKTIFRNSNFLIKTIVGLASQQVSGYINQETITSIWDKIKSITSNISTKKKPADYGIPPDSEAS